MYKIHRQGQQNGNGVHGSEQQKKLTKKVISTIFSDFSGSNDTPKYRSLTFKKMRKKLFKKIFQKKNFFQFEFPYQLSPLSLECLPNFRICHPFWRDWPRRVIMIICVPIVKNFSYFQMHSTKLVSSLLFRTFFHQLFSFFLFKNDINSWFETRKQHHLSSDVERSEFHFSTVFLAFSKNFFIDFVGTTIIMLTHLSNGEHWFLKWKKVLLTVIISA